MLENVNPEYSGDMSRRYMVFEADGESDFRLKMLCENEIPGFLNASFFDDGYMKKLGYDISGKTSLSEKLAENAPDVSLLYLLLSEMEKIFIRGRNYMFEEDDYVIHPDTVFFSETGIQLCYLPGFSRNFRSQLLALLEYLMNLIDIRNQEDVVCYYSAFVSAKDDNCTFKSLLLGIEKVKKECEAEKAEEMAPVKEPGPSQKKIKKKSSFPAMVKTLVFVSIFTFAILFFLFF